LPAAQIHVVDARDNVAAAMSEGEWTRHAAAEKGHSEPGMLRELWGGIVEDIMGTQPKLA
jgi:hypothetical protein